jgi:hypothetical protein
MDWSTVISTVVGVIAGGLVNALFSWRSSHELRREAGNLKQLTTKLMLMMDDAGLISVEWDKDGNPLRVVKLSGIIAGSGGFRGNLQVGEKANDEEGSRE